MAYRIAYRVEVYDGEDNEHVLEVFKKPSGAPYVVMVDGAFCATCESMSEARDEVNDIIKWFGWKTTKPVA